MTVTINGTTGIAGVDGSAATPAVQGVDTNTGVFYGTDIVAVSTGGTERMRVNASGNVGIGTASPSSPLNVVAASASGLAIAINGRSSDNLGLMYLYASDGTTQQATIVGSPTEFRFSSVPAAAVQTFYTNAAERMRINSSGSLLVGTTSAYGSGKTCISFVPGVSTGIALQQSIDTSSPTALNFLNAGGTSIGSVTTTASATAYNTSSDYRLKNSVAPMTTGVETIAALKPVTYKWNVDDSSGEGFIAHELQDVIPQAVVGEKDAVNDDASIKPQGVDYSKIVVHLVAAIQEQQAMITALTARITALEVTP